MRTLSKVPHLHNNRSPGPLHSGLEVRADLLKNQDDAFVLAQLALVRRHSEGLPIIYTVRSREQGGTQRCFLEGSLGHVIRPYQASLSSRYVLLWTSTAKLVGNPIAHDVLFKLRYPATLC